MNNQQLITEDDVIAYTRTKRKELADQLTIDGAPKCKDDQVVLLATLDGLDRSALSRLKIKSEEKANANNASAASLIAKILSEVGTNKLFETKINDNIEVPLLHHSILDPLVVDGEIDISPAQVDYDSFSRQFDNPDSN